MNVLKQKKVLSSCECTEEDFECDYGFVKDDFDQNKCVGMNQSFAYKQEGKVPEDCSDYYYVTKGYRYS